MSAGEGLACGVAALVSAGLATLWLCRYGVPKPRNGVPAANVKYLEFERDRVLGAAKGIGSAAVGFLTVLVTAYLAPKGLHGIPGFFLVCYVLGAVACIALAAWLNGQTRSFVASLTDPIP